MYEFIVLLRALSAMIITNAHYENIYPLSIIANGGLLGDVMFFAVSGFCLYKPDLDFLKWYGKRLVRIYPAVWIITALYLLLGYYSVGGSADYMAAFLYPTHYHFIGSIILLYIPYYGVTYCLNRISNDENKNLVICFAGCLILQLVIYLTVYDHSYYHIDSVYEPMIRLLFFEAMLIGAFMRVNAAKLVGRFQVKYLFASLFVFVLYFISKLGMVRYSWLAKYQICNQYILLILLISLFLMAGGTERLITNWPRPLWKLISYIASITLEIYLVQYALIYWFNIGRFPVNFILVTGTIVIAASLLHKVSVFLTGCLEKKRG